MSSQRRRGGAGALWPRLTVTRYAGCL